MKCKICRASIAENSSVCDVCGAIQNVDSFADDKATVSSMHFGRTEPESKIDYESKLKNLLQETMSRNSASTKNQAEKNTTSKSGTDSTMDINKKDEKNTTSKTKKSSALGHSPLDKSNEDESSEQLKQVLQTIFKSESGTPQAVKEDNHKASDITPPAVPIAEQLIEDETTEVAEIKTEPSTNEIQQTEWETGDVANRDGKQQDDKFSGFEPQNNVISEEPQWTMGEQKTEIAENKNIPAELDLDEINSQNKELENADTVFDPPPVAKVRQETKIIEPRLPEPEQEIVETQDTVIEEKENIFADDQNDIINDSVFAMENNETELETEPEIVIEEPKVRLREEVYEMHVTVASSMRRVLAGVIDLLVVFVLFMIFMGVAIQLVGSNDLPQNGNSGLFYIISLGLNHSHLLSAYGLVFFFIWTFINLVCSSTTGQTPGKMLMGIRLIKTDGETVGVVHAVVRLIGYVLSILPFFLGFLWAVVNTEKQGLHDKLAQTYVIRVVPEQ